MRSASFCLSASWLLSVSDAFVPLASKVHAPLHLTNSRQHRISPVKASLANHSSSSAANEKTSSPTGHNKWKAINRNQELNRWADAIAEAPDSMKAVAAASYVEKRIDDLVSFNTALKAWCKCSQKLSELRLRDTHGTGSTSSQQHDWSVVMDASENLAVYTPRDAVEHAEQLLQESEIADAQSFNIVMDAWSKLRQAPEAVDKIRVLIKSTPQADIFSYNALMEAFSHSSDAEDRLKNVLALYKQLPVPKNMHTVNSVLHSYSRQASSNYPQARDCSIAAERLLLETESDANLKPDVISYTAVMESWARVPGSVDKVENLMNRMKKKGIQPSTYSHAVLMQAISRSRPVDLTKAKALMDELLEGKNGVYANAVVCTAYLSVLSRSRSDGQAVEALHLLQKMNENPGKLSPSLNTYNAALDVCARTPTEHSETAPLAALKIAFAFLKSLEQHPKLQPNHATFSTLLKAISFLMPVGSPERDQLAKTVFERAKAAGQVDQFVINSLQRTCSNDMFVGVTKDMQEGRHFGADSSIPADWSKNVRQK